VSWESPSWTPGQRQRHPATGGESQVNPGFPSTHVSSQAERVSWPHQFSPPFHPQLCCHSNRLLSVTGRETRHLPWDEQAATAFTAINANATLLAHPKPHAPTRIMTDASDFAVGAVLQQEIGQSWQPVAFFSRKLIPAESRYSAFDRSCSLSTLLLSIFDIFLKHLSFMYLLTTSCLHSTSPQPQTKTLPGRHATFTTSPSLPQISGTCEEGQTRRLTHSPGQPSMLLPNHHPRR
jgi:hypothetical protein